MTESVVPRALVRQTTQTHRVTVLELFFDLVFVFAFTQVTAMMAAELSAVGALRGVVLLALLWWAWTAYAWLGNQVAADEGIARVTLLVAMAAMFVVALAIPESFTDLSGGLFAPFVLAACYAVVRTAHLACYFVAAAGDPRLRRTLLFTVVPVALAAALLVAGGAAGPPLQTALWALALLVDYAGIWLVGTGGWVLRSAGHFAERHGLIVIVALGESLVAIGVGVAGRPLSAPVVLASVLGVTVSVALWWLYFDVAAPSAERALERSTGPQRVSLARDCYTYLHFPIVASVVFVALGLKKVLEYVSDTEHHELADPLTGVPLVALLGGVAVHLLALAAVRRRSGGRWNRQRIGAAVALLVLLPLAGRVPAVAALAMVALVLAVLATAETVRYAQVRRELRSPH